MILLKSKICFIYKKIIFIHSLWNQVFHRMTIRQWVLPETWLIYWGPRAVSESPASVVWPPSPLPLSRIPPDAPSTGPGDWTAWCTGNTPRSGHRLSGLPTLHLYIKHQKTSFSAIKISLLCQQCPACWKHLCVNQTIICLNVKKKQKQQLYK